ncbi:hypothetical protein ACFW81_23835 [Streptomyces angustmyceticus]|uniref:hypothetical protein n=1 Tax=Streptomyces angustmyceticus TaxID=285578 RepID=UPI00367B4229
MSSPTTGDQYAGHHRHCYIREGQHCSCGRRLPGILTDSPTCTCQGLPMGKGQECPEAEPKEQR